MGPTSKYAHRHSSGALDGLQVVSMLKSDCSVVVWNPSGTGDDSYISIPIGTLKTSSKYLYHLDWAHFFYDVSR